MGRNERALTALVVGATLLLGPGVAVAQEEASNAPGTITTGVDAGPSSQSDVGTDGNVVGRLPGLGRPPGGRGNAAPTTPNGSTTPGGPPTIPATALEPGALPPTLTETTTAPGSTLGPVESVDASEGRGNRGNAGFEGTGAVSAGAPGEEPVAPGAPASAPAPADEVAAAPVGEPAPAAPAPAPVDGAATACGYPTWYDAQLALEADPALAGTLDADADGIACEEAMY